MQIPQDKEIHKSINSIGLRLGLAAAGITANVILCYFFSNLGLPFFLDSFGTIAISAIIGIPFTGILTAVLSSAICSVFYSASIYLAFFNALLAIFTVWFIRNHSFKQISKSLLFLLAVIFYSTLVNTLAQFLIFGSTQPSLPAQNARSLSTSGGISYLSAFFIINFMMSVLDKGLSFILVISLLNFISTEKINAIQNGIWKQRPLAKQAIRAIKDWSRDVKHSLRTRNTYTLVVTFLILIFVMGWVGGRLYFKTLKASMTQSAKSCVSFASEVIPPEKIDYFIKYGTGHPDYAETSETLRKILQVSQGIQYLYVIKIEENGCRFVFDMDSKDPYVPGQLVPFDKEFEPYFPALLAGEEIEPVESNNLFGWLLTIYHPVRDSSGKCVCYVGADISIDYLHSYIAKFLSHILVIMAGFFILIIAYAIWNTGVYTSYPISSIAACVDNFARTSENIEKLDENVRTIRSLDIRTGDEVEKLYKAICRMTLNQAEQMRDIIRLSESTMKMQDGLIITMADMVENRDSDTGAHVQKTAAYVKIIVEGLKKKGYYAQKITPKFMSDVVRSAPLHDVGKINIPDGVLNKPGKLTDEEFAIMKTHTTAGKHILENAISTVQGENYLKEARNMAAYHHERWDGKGYPEGLHGEVIPLSARIMAVADVFDALASPRVYKPAFPIEKALAILQEGAGTQFDPKCVEVFMEALPEVKMILKKYSPAV
ncbi:HD domain-containing phosphohydrolase [uncultured Treponema sp.]|uniref:HD domain-containing phosphohydrolase n=1 Tax=uncultured Treponema sp. TaxID=162155 RepID=UPI0025D87E39|nr:HD domain-containing phosphohydrolase [uncultured Treponema sp.]